MAPHKPLNLPLAVAQVDRAAHLRGDESYLISAWPQALVLSFLDEKFATKNNQLIFSSGQSLAFLSARDIGLAVHAQGLANWHKKHPRCALCGEKTVVVLAGAVRRCPADQSEHYPRTDGAIIVLVKDDKDRILLGRQKVWPKNRFSTFAGFVEPGESFENCVTREVMEEAGVKLREINYLGSQPWPFPASLMIAFEAITHTPELARADGEEIEEIRWFTREEMKRAIAEKSLILPLEISVARQMIKAWYGTGADTDLIGNESWR